MTKTLGLGSLALILTVACGSDDDPAGAGTGGGGGAGESTGGAGGAGGAPTAGNGGGGAGGNAAGSGGTAGAGAAGGAGGAMGGADGGPSPCFVTSAGVTLTFTDVTASAGVSMPSQLDESLAWGDFDLDGDEDLYVTTQGRNSLFRNDGGGNFTDVTDATGTGAADFSVGAAFGDLDADGDLDLYVVTFQAGLDHLYRNDGIPEGGTQPTFTDVAALAGTTVESSSRGVAFFDFDGDGLLDVYVNAIGPDILYHNQGSLQFSDVASQVLGTPPAGQGVGVVATDVNGDRRPDLFVANRTVYDMGAPPDPQNLFIGAAAPDGGLPAFSDIALSSGIAARGLGMGIIAFDYDNDLDVDLYWTAWPGADATSNRLYRNVDGDTFEDVTVASGTADAGGWGISANAGDVDNDGNVDFFVTNGFDPSSDPNAFFYNNGDGTFTDVAGCIGYGPKDGRGVAFADYDEDGDLDLMVTGGPTADSDTRLFRNDTTTGNAWLEITLRGTAVNLTGIGARVEVTGGGKTLMREAQSGAGRGSGNSQVIHFGLGDAPSVSQVRVLWPDGTEQTVGPTGINQRITVTQP